MVISSLYSEEVLQDRLHKQQIYSIPFVVLSAREAETQTSIPPILARWLAVLPANTIN